jgi:tetratricopeptide (TPR) repeat protein
VAAAEPFRFTLALEDFDATLLPARARTRGTPEFRDAVRAYFRGELGRLGGQVDVAIDADTVEVTWTRAPSPDSLVQHALRLLRSGKLAEAIPFLETVLVLDPNDVDSLANLGMAESDLGRLDRAVEHLRRATQIDSSNVNSHIALGVAYQRSRQPEKARHALEVALALEPDNAYSHRNLAAVLGNLGRFDEAEPHFRAAHAATPTDQATTYGLAQCLEELGGTERLSEADALYLKVIELQPDSPIGERAKEARNALAARAFRSAAPGLRMDAVMYCLDALKKFAIMTKAEVQAIGFEIALLGQRGIDVNDSAQKYTLRSLPGNFSGLQLMALMYVSFQQIAPGQSIGFDLAAEYAMAQRLLGVPGESI